MFFVRCGELLFPFCPGLLGVLGSCDKTPHHPCQTQMSVNLLTAGYLRLAMVGELADKSPTWVGSLKLVRSERRAN